MNTAVATKPRSRAALATKPIENEAPTVESCLKAVRDAIYKADHKMEAAYDATEPGDSIELVIDHIAHNIMHEAVRPILAEGIPTQATAEAVATAMFTPLATLEAAIALAGDAVFRPNLIEAFNLLDHVNNQLDVNCPLWKLLPEGTNEAAPAALQRQDTTQEPYYEVEAELHDVRNISVLVQWIERARLLCDKVNFWKQHSPQLAKVTESYSFDAPSWEDAESDALLHLAIQQEAKVCDLMKYLEGRSS